MKTLVFYVVMLFTFFGCKSQEIVKLRYIDFKYNTTKNNSFLNQELLFLKGNDTLRINNRLPYDTIKHNVIDRGIYYDCHLKKDVIYTITLKRICATDIPEIFNSYYRINTIADTKDCSKFIEIEKNTNYEYKGKYGKYIDIDGVLYEIVGLTPNNGCILPH